MYLKHKFVGQDLFCEHHLGKAGVCAQPREKHWEAVSFIKPLDPKFRPKPKKVNWIGIDGEGQGRGDHKYIFLAASSGDRKRRWSVENEKGLRSGSTLDLILWLPSRNTCITAFAFCGYDLTKILASLSNEQLYKLYRPDTRRDKSDVRQYEPTPVQWRDYFINLQSTKFTLTKDDKLREDKIVIWDVWKFFQCKFVDALKEWKITTPEALKQMTFMKDNRGNFDKMSFKGVQEYCFDECADMARLSKKLFEAHDTAGIFLKKMYGAGSSGEAMLERMKIQDQLKDFKYIPEMIIPLAMAYFGGRFECSVIGAIECPVYNFDISSAYPYQIYFLPCLKHGKWRHTINRADLDHVRHALVHYDLPNTRGARNYTSWGPFPFRESNGSISFPAYSGGGWVWKDEYIEGENLFGNVTFVEAWIYETKCDCHPFKEISEFYLERLKIGKEGAGIALKLGINSVAGKTMQSIGQAIFNNWIWAGLITSGCRAQLLNALSIHDNRRNLLMLATDGVYSKEKLKMPKPMGTRTDISVFDGSANKDVCKPLGGWEMTEYKKGVFFARPGVYFPLNLPDPATLNEAEFAKVMEEQMKMVKGRGVGKGTILRNHIRIRETYERGEKTIKLSDVSRFCGAKTCITRSGKPGEYVYKRASALPYSNKQSYGQWINKEIIMSFDPRPKRERINPDNITLGMKKLPDKSMSMPYVKALIKMGITNVKDVVSRESQELFETQEFYEEQPDIEAIDFREE